MTNTMKKFELTGEKIDWCGSTLQRIQEDCNAFPFCGGPAEYKTALDRVVCAKCGGGAAGDVWNRRTGDGEALS